MSEEEVVKPDRIGTMDKEVLRWRPMSNHRKTFKRRVFDIELWIQGRGWTEEEEIIAYAMLHFKVNRQQAREYLKEVVEKMKARGVRVIGKS